jgi:hypothetical protein
MPRIAQHYGIVAGVIGNEGEGIGDLSVSAILDPSPMTPDCRIFVGSTTTSEVNLGQFALTVAQAAELSDFLYQAIADIKKARS